MLPEQTADDGEVWAFLGVCCHLGTQRGFNREGLNR
jgi:hypothetical protein